MGKISKLELEIQPKKVCKTQTSIIFKVKSIHNHNFNLFKSIYLLVKRIFITQLKI